MSTYVHIRTYAPYVGESFTPWAAVFVGRSKCVHSLALHQFSAINFISMRVWGGGEGGGGGGGLAGYVRTYVPAREVKGLELCYVTYIEHAKYHTNPPPSPPQTKQ